MLISAINLYSAQQVNPSQGAKVNDGRPDDPTKQDSSPAKIRWVKLGDPSKQFYDSFFSYQPKALTKFVSENKDVTVNASVNKDNANIWITGANGMEVNYSILFSEGSFFKVYMSISYGDYFLLRSYEVNKDLGEYHEKWETCQNDPNCVPFEYSTKCDDSGSITSRESTIIQGCKDLCALLNAAGKTADAGTIQGWIDTILTPMAAQ